MAIDKYILRQATARLAKYWYALIECCRILNTVTHQALGVLFKLAVVAYFLFCAIVLGLRYLVLPNIDSYKPDIERVATQTLGNKVSITGIDASWAGLRPRLSLDKVIIHDRFGNPALTLPNVSATLSWWSIVAGSLHLHQLEISSPEMDVVRDADGKLYVAGIFLDTGKSGNGKGLDWVLSQREIVIRNGKLRWNDYMRAAPELLLDNVNIALHSQWRHHRFAFKATPPAALSAPLDVRAAFDHPHFARSISDPMQWKGEVYADLRNTDLTAWKSYFDYPVDLRQGRGSVRAWLKFDHSQVADLTADLSLSNVSAHLGKDIAPMSLAQVDGRVSVSEDIDSGSVERVHAFGENGHTVSLTDFSLRTHDGFYLPQTTISERFIPAKKGKPAKTEIHAKLLDLQTLANFTERLPLPAEQRRMLADLAPRGILRDFSAQWQGAYPTISGYSIKGQFAGLSLKPQPARPARPKTATTPAQAAVPAIPGFDNLTGRIDANDRGGTFSLNSDTVVLQLPSYFAEPSMPFDKLVMQANWVFQENDQLLFDVQKMDFMLGDLAGSFSGRHLMPLGRKEGLSPGTIDLSGKLNRLELQQLGRYLPANTPEGLSHWLTGALVGGAVKDVRLRLKGDLAHFPFHAQGDKPRGEFSVVGRIEDGALNYVPGEFGQNGVAPLWPVIDQINGTIVFDRTRMEIRADSARTSGTALSQVKAVIPDLSAPDMLLEVDGAAAGPLQEFVRFTNESPVGGWIGHFTEETKATGSAKLDLKLQLPLHRMREALVRGTLQFAGNTVNLMDALPPLAATSGKLEFHEKGFTIANIKSNFLGGPVTVSGGTLRDGSTLVRADGTLTADGVRKAYATPMTRRSSERITGSARYSTTIRVANHHPAIVVESNLVGIGLDFPAPLRKAANESLPLRFELVGLPGSENMSRDELRLSLGAAISARYEREKASAKGAQWRVVRGGIGVNVPAPQPDSGVMANVDLKTLDLDAWRRALSSVMSSGKQDDAQAPSDGAGIAQYIEPEALAARATELIVMDRKLDNVVVGASHQKDTWQVNIDSEQASGYLTWAESATGLGKVTARLASLIIPKSAASEVTELLEGKDTTTQIPAVDLVAENFELFGKKFGHVELQAQNASGPAGREWRINKLSMVNTDAQLKATGKWTVKDGGNLSELAYTLNINDAGKLLDRFGFVNVLRGGKGIMEGDISWKGLPFSLDIPSLNGQVKLNVAAGQFLKVDQGAQGAAKLLGVLSLQSLPRRLTLDFRDVFSEGFAFDGVTAIATISQGMVKTDNFKMRGVSATVLIDGTADVAKESADLHVVIIPEINAGTASVVYGLAVNPVIGVGTFLAQLFLRDPLMKAFTFEYMVSGPWKDPVVTKLVRKQPASPVGEATSFDGPND